MRWLAGLGSGSHLGRDSSQVHKFEEVREQALILTLTTPNDREANLLKIELTYKSHLWDDYFDRQTPAGIDFAILEATRFSPERVIAALGVAGNAVRVHLSRKGPLPKALISSLMRMAYGGLIQRAPTLETQNQFLNEYQIRSLKDVDPEVRTDLMKASSKAFWMTTKTVLEQMMATEPGYNRTLAELWNMILAPLVYHHDHLNEFKKGEIQFLDGKLPSTREMIEMVGLALNHLQKYENPDQLPLRLYQLEVTLNAFKKNLPPELQQYYLQIIDQIKGMAIK